MSKKVHRFDLRTDFCIDCGQDYRDVIKNKLPCLEDEDVIHISHTRHQQVMDERGETIRSSTAPKNTTAERNSKE